MHSERSLKIVRGHVPLRVPEEASRARLTAAVAMVLRTHRSGSDGMVLDHELWLACMAAVTQIVDGHRSEVFGVPERRLLESFRSQRLGPTVGTLEEYGRRLRDDIARGGEDSDDWGTVLWWNENVLVAAATCEAWYAVGGPAPYHDSYTTSVLVEASRVDDLIRETVASVEDVGGWVEAVVDAQSTT